MQLWKFERTDDQGYDTDRVIVIAAEDRQEAEEILAVVKDGQMPPMWVVGYVKTDYVGDAPPGTPRGVVTASGRS